GQAEQRQAGDHQSRFAKQVGGGADQRLDDREGESVDRRKAGGRRDADAEFVGDMRQHWIERARRQARGKAWERNDVQGRRQALVLRARERPMHQAALLLASASKAISLRTRPSNWASGTMLGPSEGARSGSGWVSMKTPATPTATAARASTGTN